MGLQSELAGIIGDCATGDLVNEVASHLGNAPGGKVSITVEVNAESEGFDDCNCVSTA